MKFAKLDEKSRKIVDEIVKRKKAAEASAAQDKGAETGAELKDKDYDRDNIKGQLNKPLRLTGM